LIKKIQAAGIRIDAVGIQGHWRAYNVPFKNIEESIKEYSALGIKVMFTELDLGVLPNPWDSDAADVNQKAAYDAKMNPYKPARNSDPTKYAKSFRTSCLRPSLILSKLSVSWLNLYFVLGICSVESYNIKTCKIMKNRN